MSTSSKLRNARLQAGVSLAEVGAAIGRSDMWLSYVERGMTTVPRDIENRIMVAIERLAELRAAQRRRKVELAEELRLPNLAGTSIR